MNTEIVRDPVTKEIEWAEHWQEPDPKAAEWELSRLDRANYAANDGGADTAADSGDYGEQRRAPGAVVEVFAVALELLAQYKITPALTGPDSSETVETTATRSRKSSRRTIFDGAARIKRADCVGRPAHPGRAGVRTDAP